MAGKLSEIKKVLRDLETVLNDLESSNNNDQDIKGQATAVEESLLGCLPHRVLHVVRNPFIKSIEEEEFEYDQLLRENERLKARLSLIETGNEADVTMRIDEALKNAHKIDELKQTISDYKNREGKILSSLKKTACEFREACFSLVGYRVDALKDNIYRLSHRYAANDEDKLYFEVKRDGTIILTRNEYARQYSELVRTYLEQADSFPAFLAAITLDLFNAQTPMIDMSVTMSTTVLPANTTRTSFVVDSKHFPKLLTKEN